MLRFFVLGFLFLGLTAAGAQPLVLPCIPSGINCIPISTANPLPTTTSGGTSSIDAGGATAVTNGTNSSLLYQNSSGNVAAGTTIPFGFGTSTAGSAGTPSFFVGNSTTGLYSVSTTGIGVSVNGTSIADYNITNANVWTMGGSSGLIAAGNAFYLSGGVIALSRNGSTGALTITSNAANILMTPGGGTVAITGTLTASAIAANTGAQTGYLCYNTSGGVITYDGTNTCLVSSARYKTNIRPLDPQVALEEVMRLKPSSFNRTLGDDRAERLGLIAEEVADVDARMIVRDAEGLPRGVLYETGGVALLTGAFQALKAEFDEYKRSHP